MSRITAIYVCNMCGRRLIEGVEAPQEAIDEVTSKLTRGFVRSADIPVHLCEEGVIGVLDLHGFYFSEDEKQESS